MNPALATAAHRELVAREKHWPAEVAAGRMTQAEADADILAWRAIAVLFDDGMADTPLAWSDLIAAVRTALDRQFDRLAGAQGTARAALEARIEPLIFIRRQLDASARAGGFATFRRAA